MKMNDAFSYEVKFDERITIKVTAANFLDSLISVRAERDGAVFPAEPNTSNAPVFKFPVSKSPGDIHTVMIEFTFVAGTPENAQYRVAISGQNDEGCPCGFTIEKDTADKSPDIEFVVV
ncbi:MAG TPA: hypothetical protein VGO56_06590 [Pyrinomonadaceae bacterium]|nr:hypothetical protein [Pyrinomonadaceae bacterium]